MEFLKVWTSFRQSISPLKDDEKGRLFDAMLLYAETGEEPSEFIGNEMFLWQVAKQDIDRTAARNEKLRQNGLKGGRPVINGNQEKPNITKENQDEPKETCNIKKSNIKKDKEKENKEIEERFDRFWTAYPRKESKQKAKDYFYKLKPDDDLLGKMLTAIERQKQTRQWQEDGGQYIPHASTWLNNKKWEDEPVIATVSKATVIAQQYQQRDYKTDPDYAEWERQQEEETERRIMEMMAKKGEAS